MTTHPTPATVSPGPRRSLPADPPGLPADLAKELRTALLRTAAARRRQLAELPPLLRPDPVAAAHRDTVRRLLAVAHEALDRLDAGTYGDCTACGLPIPVERLRHCPWVTTCTWCGQR